ncbi:hypothetical protein GW17_00029600 [Ensete ventricosum]|nr:hypothetical protein GW17_00029600 [Ensete ventricosum]
MATPLPPMLPAALRRAHHRPPPWPLPQAPSFPLPSPLPTNFSTPYAVCAAQCFDPIDQFLPPHRTLPRSPIRPHLYRETLLSLAYVLKTTPGRLHDLKSLASEGLRAAPLARLLCSFPRHQPSVAFFDAALPDLSADTVSSCCDAAHLVAAVGDPALKLLAQDLLASLLRRIGPGRAAEIIHWTDRHGSHYPALHLVLHAFLNAGMASEAADVLARIRRQGMTPSLPALAILLRLLFRGGDSRKAWKLFQDMIGRGPRPSFRTFNAMILGSCLKGHVRVGEGLLRVMPRLHCEPDACAAMFMVDIAGVRVLYTGDYSREKDRHLRAA